MLGSPAVWATTFAQCTNFQASGTYTCPSTGGGILIIGYGDDLQDAGIQFCLLNRDNSAAYHGSSGLYWKDDGDNQGVGHCYGYVSGGWHRLVDLVYPTVTTSNVPEGGPSVAFAVLPGDVTSGTTYITFTPDPGNLP